MPSRYESAPKAATESVSRRTEGSRTTGENVPVISMFYGVIVSLYFMDNRRHKVPHIHAKYQD